MLRLYQVLLGDVRPSPCLELSSLLPVTDMLQLQLGDASAAAAAAAAAAGADGAAADAAASCLPSGAVGAVLRTGAGLNRLAQALRPGTLLEYKKWVFGGGGRRASCRSWKCTCSEGQHVLVNMLNPHRTMLTPTLALQL